MNVLAIDPGNEQSAFCVIRTDDLKPISFDILNNDGLRKFLKNICEQKLISCAAVEMVASYGMPVGREVFDTVRWIGRYEELLTGFLDEPPTLVYRIQEKQHICHDSRAKDANIRRALIDRFARHDLKFGRGTKNNPDWFHGFKADIWAAYAVGLTYIETILHAERSETK